MAHAGITEVIPLLLQRTSELEAVLQSSPQSGLLDSTGSSRLQSETSDSVISCLLESADETLALPYDKSPSTAVQRHTAAARRSKKQQQQQVLRRSCNNYPPGSRLFISFNRPMTEAELRGLFGEYGTLERAFLFPGKHYGYAKFSTAEAAAGASKALNGYNANGVSCRAVLARDQLSPTEVGACVEAGTLEKKKSKPKVELSRSMVSSPETSLSLSAGSSSAVSDSSYSVGTSVGSNSTAGSATFDLRNEVLCSADRQKLAQAQKFLSPQLTALNYYQGPITVAENTVPAQTAIPDDLWSIVNNLAANVIAQPTQLAPANTSSVLDNRAPLVNLLDPAYLAQQRHPQRFGYTAPAPSPQQVQQVLSAVSQVSPIQSPVNALPVQSVRSSVVPQAAALLARTADVIPLPSATLTPAPTVITAAPVVEKTEKPVKPKSTMLNVSYSMLQDSYGVMAELGIGQ